MKKSKWMRLGLGACLLAMLFIFQGTQADHVSSCALCLLDMASGSGYLEIYNNTPYHIKVDIRGSDNTYGPYKITANPPFLRKLLGNGECGVVVSVYEPISQKPVLYNSYMVNVPSEYQTVKLTITTPIGYIPLPK